MLNAIPRQSAVDYDFSGYRRPACYVMALVAIKTAARTDTSLCFRVDNILVAKWLSARLRNQNYAANPHHDEHCAWVSTDLPHP